MAGASKRSRRRGATGFVVSTAAIVALGLIALGWAAVSHRGMCSTAACGLSRMEWVGLLVVAIGAVSVAVVVLRQGAAARAGAAERDPSRGAAASRRVDGRGRAEEILVRSRPTVPVPDALDRGGPSARPDDGEPNRPALADWIARARRGCEGGGAQT